jgi:hypothetical protein
MTDTPRNRAWRRAQRDKAVAYARPVVARIFGDSADMARVRRWADNLHKCSCLMCKSGDPHGSRQMRRAAEMSHLAWDLPRKEPIMAKPRPGYGTGNGNGTGNGDGYGYGNGNGNGNGSGKGNGNGNGSGKGNGHGDGSGEGYGNGNGYGYGYGYGNGSGNGTGTGNGNGTGNDFNT